MTAKIDEEQIWVGSREWVRREEEKKMNEAAKKLREIMAPSVAPVKAAWQNAAESLPVQPEQKVDVDTCPDCGEGNEWCCCNRAPDDELEPVAPVEAKEKEPEIGFHCRWCDKPIFQNGDGTWYHRATVRTHCDRVAEPKPTPSTPEPLAEKIIRRVVENTVRFMWTRNIEPLEGDPESEFPTEEELVIDALAIALGEDIGYLDEKDDDFRERIDLLWLEDQLKPQPDSSSIPDEACFWPCKEGSHHDCAKSKWVECACECHKAAAKGQSNGR